MTNITLIDLVLLGRPALSNPHWPVWTARELAHNAWSSCAHALGSSFPAALACAARTVAR